MNGAKLQFYQKRALVYTFDFHRELEAFDFMLSEKNKVSKLVDSLNHEKEELDHKRAHVKQVVDNKAAEKWIKKAMSSFVKEPCARKNAILSMNFQEIVFDNETLIYKVNLAPDSAGVASQVALARKKGKKCHLSG